MSQTIQSVFAGFTLSVRENVATAPAGVDAVCSFSEHTGTITLDSITPTVPPAQKLVTRETALNSGNSYTYNIDLTGADGTQGIVDCSGMRVQIISIVNPSTSVGNVTMDAGASNGYEINGTNELHVPPGGRLLKYLADGGVDVDATHKVIKIASNSANATPQVALVLG
jgi:hypothetical protein